MRRPIICILHIVLLQILYIKLILNIAPRLQVEQWKGNFYRFQIKIFLYIIMRAFTCDNFQR